MTPKISTVFEPGAILQDEWGYDQTNIDFYMILKRSGQWVTIQKMEKHTGPEIGFMTNKTWPGHPDETQKPFRKKIYTRKDTGEESGFTLRNYSGGGWCRLWKGEPVTESHYA